MTRLRPVVPGLALLVCTVLASGCGIGTDDAPRRLDPAAAPFRDALGEASPAPTGAGRVVVYLVRDQLLVAVPRRVPQPATPQSVLQALRAGPTERERDAGLVSATPSGAVVTALSSDGLVTVELPAADATLTARSDEVLGYGQLVASLGALRGVTGVVFVRDGERLAVPRGDGQLSAGPLTRRDYSALL